eukprot:1138377-Pelagomonas_calceolata.AAC.2
MQHKNPSSARSPTLPASPRETDPLTCKTSSEQEVALAVHEDETHKFSALEGCLTSPEIPDTALPRDEFGGYRAQAELQKGLQLCL